MDAISSVAELDRRFGLPGTARVCEGNGELPKICISSSHGEGEMYPHGAQVTSWKPAGHREVLFMSTKSRWQDGQVEVEFQFAFSVLPRSLRHFRQRFSGQASLDETS